MRLNVAPPAGAWIEIKDNTGTAAGKAVAPPAGAWIEMSLGLKACTLAFVAPPAGAWIEMLTSRSVSYGKVSRLPQARGLK